MAYKGRVLECLTAEGRKFFKDELKANDKLASLRKIEALIYSIVRPYKIGLYVFLGTILILSGLLFFKAESAMGQRLAAMRMENLKLREERDDALLKLARTGKSPALAAQPSDLAHLDQLAYASPERFYNQVGYLAEKKMIPQDEIKRLIRVGAEIDPGYTLRRVRSKPELKAALSRAELGQLVRKAAKK